VNKLGLDIDTDEADPTPLIVWLEGGPGCSSTGSVLFENGPWYYNVASGGLEVRNQTWALDYHLLFIDAPAGTGFSFVGSGDEYITTSEQYAQQIYAALQGIAVDHSSWLMASRPLYLFGESYAGHWIPSLGSYIIQQNSQVPVTGNAYLPLAGAGIGNAWTDPINQVVGYADFGFALGLFNEQQRANISYYEQLSVSWINAGFKSEATKLITQIWSLATYFTGGMDNQCGINIYNYRDYCGFDFNYTAWCTNSKNKASLGIPASVQYVDCSATIFQVMSEDISTTVTPDVVFMLQHVPMLLYTGADDFIVNIVLGEQWLANLDWPGQEGYLNAPKYSWKVNGEVAGFSRTYDKLTQLTVLKAGHLLPHDQTQISRELAKAFISGEGFQN
jgi:vitellogenic carboxypeptidase-like protein